MGLEIWQGTLPGVSAYINQRDNRTLDDLHGAGLRVTVMRSVRSVKGLVGPIYGKRDDTIQSRCLKDSLEMLSIWCLSDRDQSLLR